MDMLLYCPGCRGMQGQLAAIGCIFHLHTYIPKYIQSGDGPGGEGLIYRQIASTIAALPRGQLIILTCISDCKPERAVQVRDRCGSLLLINLMRLPDDITPDVIPHVIFVRHVLFVVIEMFT